MRERPLLPGFKMPEQRHLSYEARTKGSAARKMLAMLLKNTRVHRQIWLDAVKLLEQRPLDEWRQRNEARMNAQLYTARNVYERARDVLFAPHYEPREPNPLEVLADLVATHDYSYLDRGIGTNLPEGKAWVAAREHVRRSGVSSTVEKP